jgi:hypothetical protein
MIARIAGSLLIAIFLLNGAMSVLLYFLPGGSNHRSCLEWAAVMVFAAGYTWFGTPNQS